MIWYLGTIDCFAAWMENKVIVFMLLFRAEASQETQTNCKRKTNG